MSPYANPVPGSDQRAWLNADPVAGFWHFLRSQGLNQLDPVSQFAQRQFDPTQNMYRADAAANPMMGFYDYLSQPGRFDFRTQYANQSPEQRGDFGNRTHAARARWVTPR